MRKSTLCFSNSLSETKESYKKFLDQLGKELGVQKHHDWYNFQQSSISRQNQSIFKTLLSNFGNSPSKLFVFAYPDHPWLDWKFKFHSVAFWKSEGNHRIFMDWLGAQLGFQNMDDWYQVLPEHINDRDGAPLLRKYSGSISRLMISVYPEHKWQMWNFESKTTKGYWQDATHAREFIDWLGIHLGFTKKEDWYKITGNHLVENKGTTLLMKFAGGSPSRLIMSIYPEHKWQFWKFETVPKGLWEDLENQRQYLDWLGVELGFKKMEDLYQLNKDHFTDTGGLTLLSKYGYSRSKLLTSVYPDHNWDISQFDDAFMDQLGIKLGFKKMEDWYNITAKDILDNGGSALLARNDYLPSKILMSTYSNHNWLSWKFNRNWTLSLDQFARIEVIAWLAQEFKIRQLEDWYQISWHQISEKVSPRFFDKYSLEQILSEAYPEHTWDVERLQSKYPNNMRVPQRIVAKVLPESGIIFTILFTNWTDVIETIDWTTGRL